MQTRARNLLETKLPYNFTILLTTVIFFLIASIFNWVWLAYVGPFFLIFYIQFCRFCGTVVITPDQILVKYVMPWNQNHIIGMVDILNVDYQKGFYSPLSSKSIGEVYVFPKYCFDRLIVNLKSSREIIININTRNFNEILECLSIPIE